MSPTCLKHRDLQRCRVRQGAVAVCPDAESGSLEARLTVVTGPELFIPTLGVKELPAPELARLTTRSRSEKNPSYLPLTAPSFNDFDWLYVRDSTALARRVGGPGVDQAGTARSR